MTNLKKATIHETIKLTLRGYKLWWKISPQYFVAMALHGIVTAISPYVGIYLTAQIINEIAGNRNQDRLTHLVLAALISTAVLGLIAAILSHWKKYHRDGLFLIHGRIYSKKLTDMDFPDVDSTHTHEQLSQILQSASWGEWGLWRLHSSFDHAITAVFKILGAVALSVSLFTLPVPNDAGTLTILNNPLFVVGIILMLLAATFIAPMLSNRASSYWYRLHEEMKLGNRFFVFFAYFTASRERAMDVRMYRQERISKYYNTDNMKEIWGNRGQMARYSRGPSGLLSAASTAVGHVFTAVIYIFVCLKAWGGAFGVGSITQYVGAITALSSGMSTLIMVLGEIRNNTPYLRDCFSFLDKTNAMYQGSLTTEKRSDNKYEITFRNVSFKYPGTDTYAIKNLNLSFVVGQRLAIVGQNGSGKTTFIKLLCRLYDPTEGEILLNGFDIRKYDYRQYMDIFTVVFQDFQLLSVPLGQNVAAAAEYDKDKVTDCLTRAGFAERLNTMSLETCLYKDFEDDGV